jgi:hypothetical protein
VTAAAFQNHAAREQAAIGYEHAFGAEPDYLPELDLAPEPTDAAAWFDDSDGAAAFAEPDPFAEPVPVPLRRPSLRAELGALPAGPITGLPRRSMPPLPVPDGLAELVPDGLRRGSTIEVSGSVSLLLALLGRPSQQGAWTALVGMPSINAEAAAEAGIDLSRLAIIGPPEGSWTPGSWTTAVGALLDAVDVVVARPGAVRPGGGADRLGPGRPGAARPGPGRLGTGRLDTGWNGAAPNGAARNGAAPNGAARNGAARNGAARNGVSDGDARRLTSRARNKDALLVLFGEHAEPWPGVHLRLSAERGDWTGIGNGYGRLVRRRLMVSATGRGRSARTRTGELWL